MSFCYSTNPNRGFKRLWLFVRWFAFLSLRYNPGTALSAAIYNSRYQSKISNDPW